MGPATRNETPVGNTIPDGAMENLLPLWVFAVAWLGASVFVTTPMVRDALKTHDAFQLLVLAFPATGLGLVAWAALQSWRIPKFGRSVLRLGPGPVMPGGELAGIVHVTRPIPCDRPTRLRLRCFQRTRRAQQRTRVSEIVLFEQSQTLDGRPNDPGATETEIPIRFHIPPEAGLRTRVDGGCEVLWRLEVHRPSGLLGYFARFEVPVGVVDAREPTAPPGPERAVHRAAGAGPWREPPEAGITCRRMEGGCLDFRLAAAHHKPLGLTLIGLFLTCMAAGLFLAPAPGLMRIITIAFGSLVLLPAAFLDCLAAWLWLVGQQVTVRRGSVVMRRSIGPFHWGRTFGGGDITEITCEVDGSSSTSKGRTLTYHGIQLQTRDGKSAWLASNIADGDYAAWLTDEINSARSENRPPGREPIVASTGSRVPPG